jgi:hypothetical protein
MVANVNFVVQSSRIKGFMFRIGKFQLIRKYHLDRGVDVFP